MTETPIADVVDLMVGDGASAKAIAAAVRAIEASAFRPQTVRRQSADTSDKRRERDRIRHAEKRAKLRTLREAAKANDVAARPQLSVDTSADGAEKHCVLSSLSESVLKEETTKKEEPRAVVVEGRKRGTRLTADWQPSDDDRQFATDHNVDPGRLRNEFVDFWIGVPGQRGTKLDWSATWRNRVRAIGGHTGAKNGKRTVHDAASDLLERVRSLDQVPAGIRGGEGQPPLRLLPPR